MLADDISNSVTLIGHLKTHECLTSYTNEDHITSLEQLSLGYLMRMGKTDLSQPKLEDARPNRALAMRTCYEAAVWKLVALTN